MAYSHSSLSTFETCPKQYEHQYILKDIERKDTEATLWGTKVHEALESYALEGTAVPEGVAPISAMALEIINHTKDMEHPDVLVEWEFGITQDFKLTSFNDPLAFVRGIVDYGVLSGDKAILCDWKTGKKKADFNQMEIFTIAIFLRTPEVTRVKSAYIWLKTQERTEQIYTREELPSLIERVSQRIRVVDEHVKAENFTMKPSGLCRGWCPVTQCPLWKEPR